MPFVFLVDVFNSTLQISEVIHQLLLWPHQNSLCDYNVIFHSPEK